MFSKPQNGIINIMRESDKSTDNRIEIAQNDIMNINRDSDARL